ncbi:manganese-dependent inorganic pyrophosphatase [Falsirhodobacter sp. alg1]|uniref:manganese-dependent inorganic pyrophosphatase n=1 Tax=Falsirhodobacter sp. alg1 TaxID=1472418 RepID=UPI0005EE52C5|nr:manganese-dependent inorganic pyrophosphatase [Falsirhodobacter sp. alg1]
MIKVFGHKSPDTDCTASAIIWAWYQSEMRGQPAKPYVLGEPNTEALFVLNHWEQPKPELLTSLEADDEVIIVDTNNPAELPDNINDANILSIIDHHMLVGGLKTRTPIDITIRPLACTATLMFDLMGAATERAPRHIKGLILSCILSDTLAFRSPTTTPHDRAVAEDLARELRIDMAAYADEMFAAKSDVSAFSDKELLKMDSKEYTVGETALRVSVLETTSPAPLLARKQALVDAMPAVAAADGAHQVLLFIIDIVREEAILLVPNDLVKTIAEKSFGVTVTGDTVVLPGVMSRKKQIIPALAI